MDKICKECKIPQSTDNFYKHSATRDKLFHECKSCWAKRIKAYAEAHRVERRASAKSHYQNHREKERAKLRAYHNAHKEQRKAYREMHKEERHMKGKIYGELHKRDKSARWYKRKYGTDLEQVEKLIEEQQNRCKICYVTFDKSVNNTTPVLDHDHNTGQLRGILCRSCNMGIGALHDDPDIITRASLYLQKMLPC